MLSFSGLNVKRDARSFVFGLASWVLVLLDPFQGMVAWRNSTETQLKRATPQSLDQWSKMEELVPRLARRRGSESSTSRRLKAVLWFPSHS